ncbi:MAG TPA: PilZ domain-containing protein, partial [Oscillospiraceae bacterium]|nr:PilZ domain-containing protein [Oscillospiraceae bacterium]
MPITIAGAVQQKKIAVGKQVSLTNSHADLTCRAKVVDVLVKTLLLQVTTPDMRQLKALKPQSEVIISFTVPDDAIYACQATIASFNEDAALIQIKQATPLERREQRLDYRLKTAEIIYILAEQPDSPLGQDWHQACLLDISRGGASILTSVALPIGTEISVWIPLDEVDHVLEATAQVVRLKQGEEGQAIAGVS